MKQAQWRMSSPIGPLFLVGSEKGLQGIYWKKRSTPMAPSLDGNEPAIRYIVETIKQLDLYFAGQLRDFTVPLDLVGTEFQKKVWGQLRKIPYGKTHSYKDVAEKINNKKAVRAVGTANGRNPISIIVPCHRVIASDGTLGGYAGGLSIKTQLLELEQKSSRRA